MTAKNSRNFIFLLSALLIGESVVSLPLTGNGGNDLLGGIFGLTFAAIVLLSAKVCYKRLRLGDGLNTNLRALLLLAIAVLSLLSLSICLFKFSDYAGKVMLNNTPILLPLISLLLLSVFTVRKGKEVVFKLGSVLFFLSAIFIILMLAFSVPFIEMKYLGMYKAPTLGGFLRSFLSFGGSALLSALPVLYISKEQKNKSVIKGFVLGGGAVLVCLINTLGVFGAEFANTLSFPYSEAVSTASVGKIFSRMDPFLYCVCFFTCLLKCSVCLYATYLAVKNLPFKILFRKK